MANAERAYASLETAHMCREWSRIRRPTARKVCVRGPAVTVRPVRLVRPAGRPAQPDLGQTGTRPEQRGGSGSCPSAQSRSAVYRAHPPPGAHAAAAGERRAPSAVPCAVAVQGCRQCQGMAIVVCLRTVVYATDVARATWPAARAPLAAARGVVPAAPCVFVRLLRLAEER